MNTKLGLLKQVVLAACCAASVGAMPNAHADSGYAVSIGTAPAYYGDYYYGPPTRCYYDYYGYYRCQPYDPYSAYYARPYYGPAISFGYYSGWRGGWRGRDWDDRRFHWRR